MKAKPPPAVPATHSLMPLLTSTVRLKHAARGCMRTASSPGADGLTWQAYRQGLDQRIARLADRLASGSWQPAPVRQVSWQSGSKQLAVAIPTVEDRIVHRALRACLEPILEAAAYPEWMFGWRPGRTRVHALSYALRYTSRVPWWAVDIDVAAVTAGGQVSQAVGSVARWVQDGAFLATLEQALAGLPSPLAPGSGLCPLLTNLRLFTTDQHVEDLDVVRFTDNYAAFAGTRSQAEASYLRITEALAAAGLRPNPAKSKIWQPNLEDLFLAG
jgi:hypothetical protein